MEAALLSALLSCEDFDLVKLEESFLSLWLILLCVLFCFQNAQHYWLLVIKLNYLASLWQVAISLPLSYARAIVLQHKACVLEIASVADNWIPIDISQWRGWFTLLICKTVATVFVSWTGHSKGSCLILFLCWHLTSQLCWQKHVHNFTRCITAEEKFILLGAFVR